MSKKIYIVTAGEYSDYRIVACFSTRKKAEEYVKNKIISGSYRETTRIESFIVDRNVEIVDVIDIWFTFDSPFCRDFKKEKLKIDVKKGVKFEEEDDSYIGLGNWGTAIHIIEMANPNKTIEEEKKRLTKVVYDIAKKVNYLYKVENIRDYDKISKILRKS